MVTVLCLFVVSCSWRVSEGQGPLKPASRSQILFWNTAFLLVLPCRLAPYSFAVNPASSTSIAPFSVFRTKIQTRHARRGHDRSRKVQHEKLVSQPQFETAHTSLLICSIPQSS